MKKTKNENIVKKRENIGGTFAASIPLIGFAIFGILPLILAAVISLTDLHSTDLSEMQFIGFKNYLTILTNGDEGRSYSAYWTTLLYTANVPLCIAFSLYISYLVNKLRWGKTFFRSMFFIPYVCSTAAISLIFKTILFRYEGGIVNVTLQKLGFEPVGWLTGSPWLFILVALIMSVWSGMGWCIVLFQAALANVDESYYEAARIDGATSSQMFWKITWPAISPTTSFIITMKLIGSIQAMAEMMLLATGSTTPVWKDSVAWVSDTVVKHIYNMIFEKGYQFGYGLASAAGWILAIVIFIITKINLKAQRKWVNYDF